MRRQTMKPSDNHSRAQKMVDSWPSWKKDVSLTKHSIHTSNTDVKAADRGQKSSCSLRESAEVSV